MIYLGDGVGLRAAHYSHLLTTDPADWGVDWFEAITEDYLDPQDAEILDHIADARPVALHGLSLNIGSTDPLDVAYVRQVAALAQRVNAPWVSDHLCWTGVDGIQSHDLWPLPLTERCLAHVADRIHAVQDALGRLLVLENPSSYVQWRASTMPEWEFLGRLVDLTGCRLLLDVNNVYVTSRQGGFEPADYLAAIPAESIAYVHVAGHVDHGSWCVDTHDRPVASAVWALYRDLVARVGQVSTVLEWDTRIPSWPVLVAELGKAKVARG